MKSSSICIRLKIIKYSVYRFLFVLSDSCSHRFYRLYVTARIASLVYTSEAVLAMKNQGSIPGWGKRLFSSPKHPVHLWDPPSNPYTVCCSSFLWVKKTPFSVKVKNA
jgi:hypothetical protein